MNHVMTHQSPPSLGLTEQSLRAAFSARELEAGRVYELRGRVHNVTRSADGRMISAEVIGTAPKPYAQRIRLLPDRSGNAIVVGACTCPMSQNCKHVAAVLVSVRRMDAAATLENEGLRPALANGSWAEEERRRAPVARLPSQIDLWLEDLQRDSKEETEEFPDDVRHRLLYTLGRDPGRAGVPALSVQPFNATLRKDGKLSHIKQYPAQLSGSPARFLRPSDRYILSRLGRRSLNSPLGGQQDDAGDTLRRMLATGRAYWSKPEGAPLTEGRERAGRIEWELGQDGTQRAILALDPGLVAVRIPEPWYIDPEGAEMGPVRTDLPIGVVNKLLAAPPIPAEVAARVREEIARRVPSMALPAPNALPDPVRVPGPPGLHLRLMRGALPNAYQDHTRRHNADGNLQTTPVARLAYYYGDFIVPCTDQDVPRVHARGGTLYQIDRDLKAERGAVDRLAELGLGRISRLMPVWYRHAHSDDFAMAGDDGDDGWLRFALDEIDNLRADGWSVEVDEDFPFHVVRPDSDFDAELIESSGIDWLELHLGVMVGGERIDMIPALVNMLDHPMLASWLENTALENVPVKLTDGRLLALPLAKLRPTLMALIELFGGGIVDSTDGRIRLSRMHASDLAAIADRAQMTWRGGEALIALGQRLREAGGAIPVAEVPDTFQGSLRAYQQHGVDWLQFLREAGLGGVLADDMGLGKTVQTLAHLMIEKAAGRLDKPALIVCPTSVMPNWRSEAEKFAPSLRVLPLHGLTRKARFPEIPAHDLVLTTYPLLARDHEVLTRHEWHVVVLDEAQTIKNPNSATTRQALRLRAAQRLCLSGTPLQNHLGELWSLFDFLAPGFLGAQQSFRARYRTPIEKHGDQERAELLARRVRPFLLRRTKQEVVAELPPKTEITDQVELEDGQRAIYEAIRLAMHEKVKAAIGSKGLARSGIVVLDALLKMRQACCDPRLLKLQAVSKSKAGSAKMDRLMDMLSIMLDEGRRVLLFSQFTEMLALIEERLRADKIEYVLLTGDTRDRATPVRRFQDGEVPLFLISLKAGGVGLNLTAADTVIHYDPWWNPAVEDQATDRAYRIGQDKPVFVHRLVTLGTIEEKMEVLKERKREIVASVMNAEQGGLRQLTEADIEALFAPA
jgi:superfamily II DNA or RNA helicase